MSAATTMRPLGYAGTGPARSLALLDVAEAISASCRLRAHPVVGVTRLAPPLEQPARGYGGTGPSPALALLDVAQGYAYGAPPWIWRRGADNEAHCTSSAAFERG